MHVERQERCVRRAMWLMAVLLVGALLGLGYSVILLYELPVHHARILNHTLIILGLASFISLLAFTGVWLLYRHRLAVRREEVRRLVMKLLADRAGGHGAARNS